MPGVPPDALAQVKKGLRGLFGRKKANHNQSQPQTSQQQQGTPTTKTPTATSSAAAPAAVGGAAGMGAGEIGGGESEPSAPTPSSTQPSASQIPPPNTLTEAKDVDLNPVAPSTTTPAPAAAPAATTAPAPDVEERVDQNGMSATSGPLDDGIAHGFGDVELGREGEGMRKAGVEEGGMGVDEGKMAAGDARVEPEVKKLAEGEA